MTTEIDAEGLAWPERLVLRDTKVFADEGQRIFTTATGHGYAKQEYVRDDLATTRTSEAEPVAWLHLPTGNVFGNDADYRKRLDAWKRQFGDHVIHDFEPLGRISHPTPASDDQVESVWDVISDLEWVHRQGGLGYRIHDKLEKCISALAAMGSTKP